MNWWNMDLHRLGRFGIVIAIHQGDLNGGRVRLRADPIRFNTVCLKDVPRPGEGGRVRGVLLVPALEQHHANIECERRYEEDREHAPSKEDEHLATLTWINGAASC